MSETSFPINDLLRRKLQTALIVASLALSVASTLFLLLFAEKIGFSVSLMIEGKLTAGFSASFSPFILLLIVLIFIAGAVMVSFMTSLMISRRIKDIGLMKAAGCPNDLVFGYFLTELIVVIFSGCFLGTLLGLLANFASTNILGSLGLQAAQAPLDPWAILGVFASYFIIALVVGAKPVYSASSVEPAKAFSPTYYLGLGSGSSFKVLSKSNLAFRVALRSLIRHRSATVKIVVCLSIVFALITVGVAGGFIADQTTQSWLEKAIGRNTVLIAQQNMGEQYELLLKEFYEGTTATGFNYTDERYVIPENLLENLSSTYGDNSIDPRIVLEASVAEVEGFSIPIGGTSANITTVGDSRTGQSIVEGVEPGRPLNDFVLDGIFLNEPWQVVVGDTLSKNLFTDPLANSQHSAESLRVLGQTLTVVGICLDPINNGKVAYVSFQALQNASGMLGPNILLLEPPSTANRTAFLNQLNATIKAVNPEFAVFDLNDVLNKCLSFVNYMWSTVMILPLFSLVAASLCLVGYVMLAVDEQRQEFGILRAVGAKPSMVLNVVSGQSLLILLSSYGVGIAFGIIATLLILVQQPLVTVYNVLEISGLLTVALVATLVSSLYPASRFARKPLLEMMRQT
ncbi:MAG TPA: ABC transporter permease [Candidatus Acidoferrales bacterium]|nr:ABC transporter permease [Candidatus Acidoferrales bacterium]